MSFVAARPTLTLPFNGFISDLYGVFYSIGSVRHHSALSILSFAPWPLHCLVALPSSLVHPLSVTKVRTDSGALWFLPPRPPKTTWSIYAQCLWAAPHPISRLLLVHSITVRFNLPLIDKILSAPSSQFPIQNANTILLTSICLIASSSNMKLASLFRQPMGPNFSIPRRAQ